ncbi:hypothetical protein [Rhizobium sp. AC44/96]|uniref:hypothetical protein n=1 Tax=Rhizobium sp. AC44/96 TaxID=1841654 RepID=UPI001301497E|nr:hypothetical protein [Rhizobium sp. AC44/96]
MSATENASFKFAALLMRLSQEGVREAEELAHKARQQLGTNFGMDRTGDEEPISI